MSEQLVQVITDLLKGKIGNEFICFVISLLPILELRGGLLAASPAFLDVPLGKALIVCIIGNLLPIPFVLLLIEKILDLMENGALRKDLLYGSDKKPINIRGRYKSTVFGDLYSLWEYRFPAPVRGQGVW